MLHIRSNRAKARIQTSISSSSAGSSPVVLCPGGFNNSLHKMDAAVRSSTRSSGFAVDDKEVVDALKCRFCAYDGEKFRSEGETVRGRICVEDPVFEGNPETLWLSSEGLLGFGDSIELRLTSPGAEVETRLDEEPEDKCWRTDGDRVRVPLGAPEDGGLLGFDWLVLAAVAWSPPEWRRREWGVEILGYGTCHGI